MNATVQRCIFVVATGVWLLLAVLAPWTLSDKNEFLKEFLRTGFLSFMGIFVTITLASAASIHLEFNKIEDAAKREFLAGARGAVKRSAFSLVWMLLLGVVISASKAHLPQTDVATALVNGLALLIVLFSLLVLVDITSLAFSIKPLFKMAQDQGQ
eukprot:TRINITY_DN14842_c0_g1_i7.p2 TRINITY_DN14842_c0_g1~~TRINITY_DN14842_c0_g1_i7.p2  ORF type:complete len:156 (-),score=17.12 TRINITY_DN14842_c0_g1_i7:170-637(-)